MGLFVCVCVCVVCRVCECVCGCMLKIWTQYCMVVCCLTFVSWFHETRQICICVECPTLQPVELCVSFTCWWPSLALLLPPPPLYPSLSNCLFWFCPNLHSFLLQIVLCAHPPCYWYISLPTFTHFSFSLPLTSYFSTLLSVNLTHLSPIS